MYVNMMSCLQVEHCLEGEQSIRGTPWKNTSIVDVLRFFRCTVVYLVQRVRSEKRPNRSVHGARLGWVEI